MTGIWAPSFQWPIFVLRGGVVYIAVLLLLRLGGKRQIGQMGAGEFAAILLISNAVQNSMTGGDNSITGGVLIALTIVLLSIGVEYLSFKSKRWEAVIQGRPTLLIHQGKLLQQNLDKEMINLHELKTMLRKQAIHNLEEIDQAVLESDGSVSVVKRSEARSSNFASD